MTNSRDRSAETEPPVPVYVRRSADAPTLLYGGRVEIEVSDGVHVCYGEVELTEGASGPLVVHVVGNEGWMASGVLDETPPIVRLPADANLQPPESSALPSRPEHGGWVDWPIHINTLEHGDVDSASRFVIHIAGDLGRFIPRPHGQGPAETIELSLPGWQVRLRDLVASDTRSFSHVAECIAEASPTTREELNELRRRLFTLLSLAAGCEVGVGPIAGLSASADIRYAWWGVGRARGNRTGVRWCPEHLLASAIPSLADGLASLANDPAIEQVVDRATGLLCAAAAGKEVLDVRIPIACSGLELVAWAALQRRGWIGADALSKLPTGAAVRLLLQSCSMSPELPRHFAALASPNQLSPREWCTRRR